MVLAAFLFMRKMIQFSDVLMCDILKMSALDLLDLPIQFMIN
jgi:hypothetical protein